MEPNSRGQKLAIPVRNYNLNQAPSSEIPSNSFMPTTNFEEEKKTLPAKVKIPTNPYNPSLSHPSQVTSFTMDDSNLVHQTFEQIRNNIKKKLEANIKILTDQYQNSLSALKKQAESELSELGMQENDLIMKLILSKKETLNSNSSHPIARNNFDNKSEKSSISNQSHNKLQNTVLISHLNNTVQISKDLNKINNLKLPEGFTKGSNVMMFNKSEVFLVFETGEVYTLNINSLDFKRHANTKIKKSYFGLCFIGNKPAVIGGIEKESNIVTNSVEVYESSKWTSEKKLNKERSHCHAIKHEQNTYVFGGFSAGYVMSIEKHENKWTLLSISIPERLTNFGLCSKNESIYLFGGENTNDYLLRVYKFDTVSQEIKIAEKSLKSSFCDRTNGCVGFFNGEFYLLNSTTKKIIKYS